MQTAAEGTLRKDRQISKHAWFYVIPKKRFFFCRFLRQDGIFEVFFLVFCGSDFASFSFLSIFASVEHPQFGVIFRIPDGSGWPLGSLRASGGASVTVKNCNSNVCVVFGGQKLLVILDFGEADRQKHVVKFKSRHFGWSKLLVKLHFLSANGVKPLVKLEFRYAHCKKP